MTWPHAASCVILFPAFPGRAGGSCIPLEHSWDFLGLFGYHLHESAISAGHPLHLFNLFCQMNSLFFFNFIFKLYIIVLVLPNIKMNPPQVHMCYLTCKKLKFDYVYFKSKLYVTIASGRKSARLVSLKPTIKWIQWGHSDGANYSWKLGSKSFFFFFF